MNELKRMKVQIGVERIYDEVYRPSIESRHEIKKPIRILFNRDSSDEGKFGHDEIMALSSLLGDEGGVTLLWVKDDNGTVRSYNDEEPVSFDSITEDVLFNADENDNGVVLLIDVMAYESMVDSDDFTIKNGFKRALRKADSSKVLNVIFLDTRSSDADRSNDGYIHSKCEQVDIGSLDLESIIEAKNKLFKDGENSISSVLKDVPSFLSDVLSRAKAIDFFIEENIHVEEDEAIENTEEPAPRKIIKLNRTIDPPSGSKESRISLPSYRETSRFNARRSRGGFGSRVMTTSHFDKIDKNVSLGEIYDALSSAIVGQDRAVLQVADIIKNILFPLNETLKFRNNRGGAFFAGPSGTGKTQMAYEMSKFLFGTDETVIKLNMANYSNYHEISALIGAPTGYQGSTETPWWIQKIKEDPNRIIIFDEIEKAHPKIMDILLGLLVDKEFVTQGGVKADMSKTFIILTSNVGQKEFTANSIAQEVHNFFGKNNRTEILGRIGGDKIVSFQRFDTEEKKLQLFTNIFNSFNERLQEDALYKLEISNHDLREFGKSVINSINWKFGARDLKAAVISRLMYHIEAFINNNVKSPNEKEVSLHENTPIKLMFIQNRLILNDKTKLN